MNPYRQAFYSRQAEWHHYEGVDDVRRRHENRARYYGWFLKDWLDLPKTARVLDIGTGSGQLLYFLRKEGFTDLRGVDLDARQVEIARELGLDARCQPVEAFFAEEPGEYDLIAMLDILEHFTREELFPLLETVVARLKPGGRLVVSVPNAESPHGLYATYADITHEISFTPMSLEEMLFCHGLKVVAMRDPWPAPVSPARAAYRAVVRTARAVESVRLRLLGFEPPKYWSSVVWALAEKPGADAPPHAEPARSKA